MKNKTLAEQMADLCEQAGCSPKITKVHHEQALRGWHSHPTMEFETWWREHPDYSNGIDSKRAYNCERYRQQFLAAKETGVA